MRPLPTWPRGPGRPRASAAPGLPLLACPRVSPEWELAALRALVKPQTKGAIAHRGGVQPWPAGAADRVADVTAQVNARLGTAFAPLFAAGDYHVVFGGTGTTDPAAARALAVAASGAVPDTWFVCGRLLVRGGAFFRRERGYKLNLVPATNVHLPRDVRAALRGVL